MSHEHWILLQVRQGLKTYSDWPTYPQLYADGELLGGCDIIMELANQGELKEAMPAAALEVGLSSFWFRGLLSSTS